MSGDRVTAEELLRESRAALTVLQRLVIKLELYVDRVSDELDRRNGGNGDGE